MRLLTAFAHKLDPMLQLHIAELALSTGHLEAGVGSCRACCCTDAAVVNYYMPSS